MVTQNLDRKETKLVQITVSLLNCMTEEVVTNYPNKINIGLNFHLDP